jgi:tRNA-dihydrouridine synthase
MALDAARYKSTTAKVDATKKRVKKVPVTTKPRQGEQKTTQSQELAKAQAKFKQTGSVKDAHAVQLLKERLN